jgi:hypothetical protein
LVQNFSSFIGFFFFFFFTKSTSVHLTQETQTEPNQTRKLSLSGKNLFESDKWTGKSEASSNALGYFIL